MAEPTYPWLREIDHTGDIGIEVEAGSLDELFVRAAQGLFAVLTDPEAVEARATQEVVAEAEDRDGLLVRWLSEVNYLHVTEGWLFSAFEVEARTDRRIAARARGERYDPARHTLYTEIKAVTYHGLEIRQAGDHWFARIIFDM